VQAAWDNHFAAFGGKDVDKVLLDYTESSVIRVYNNFNGELTIFEGLEGAKKCFTGLFATLTDLSTLEAPVVDVTANGVFLVWKCPGMGYQRATDTFLFDSNGKIERQNVVVYYDKASKSAGPNPTPTLTAPAPVQAGWDNHFAAFGEQDVGRILKDYTEDSVLTVYDQRTAEKNVYRGLARVKEAFQGLFKALSSLDTLAAPVVHVEGSVTPQCFLVWKCPGCKFTEATDTFLFDSHGKITCQNVVLCTEE